MPWKYWKSLSNSDQVRVIAAVLGSIATIIAAVFIYYGEVLPARENRKATATAQAEQVTQTAVAMLSATPTVTLTPTPSLTPSPSATPTISPTPTPLTIVSRGDGLDEYLVHGSGWENYEPGDDLIVYGFRLNREVPVGLLRVTGKNPDTLSVQALLVHEDHEIEPNLRVDDKIENLQTSELVPAYEGADGYLTEPGVVRLRPDIEVERGMSLEVLEPLLDDQAITDYFLGPKMRITQVGTVRRSAQVEMIGSREWPALGALVRVGPVILYDADFSVFSPESNECNSYEYDPATDEWVLELRCPGRQAGTFVNQSFSDFHLEIVARKEKGFDRGWYGIVVATGRGTENEVRHRFFVSGMGTYTYEIATFDGGDSQAGLEIVTEAELSSNINRGNDDNELSIIRNGRVIEFWVNGERLLDRVTTIDEDAEVQIGMVIIAGSQYADEWEEEMRVAYRSLIVYESR